MEIINYILFGTIIITMSFALWLFLNFFIFNKKKPNEIVNDISKNINHPDDLTGKISSTKKNRKKKKSKANQIIEDPNLHPGNTILNFDKILNDMIFRGNGELCSMVIECRGVNIDLMSQDEKLSIQQAFIDFLNYLSFPIQIFVQTRTIDYMDNFSIYDQRIKTIEDDLRSLLTKFNKLKLKPTENKKQILNSVIQIQKKRKLFEYAKDLKTRLQKLCKQNYILQKKYYIVISSSAKELGLSSDFKKESNLHAAYNELTKMCEDTINALHKCGIEASVLNSYQLVELLYSAVNFNDNNLYKIREAMEAGFFKLYSSSKS